MKFKAIIGFLLFFIGTPLIIGQNGLPTVPTSTPALPNVNTESPLANLPNGAVQTPTEVTSLLNQTPSSLPVDALRDAGINTSTLTNQNPSALADQLRSRYGSQGILNDAFSTPLPSTDTAAALGKEFARKMFPEEFQAAQGGLGAISSLPTNTPSLSDITATPLHTPSSLPTSFSTPTDIPSGLPNINTPSVDLPTPPSI